MNAKDKWPDSVLSNIVTSPSNRCFLVKFFPFENGCFIVVSEGSNRIGGMYVSISSSNKIDTAKVIPSKYDSMFINTLSQRVASLTNGICIVCIHSVEKLQLDDMKSIMEKIISMVEESNKKDLDK